MAIPGATMKKPRENDLLLGWRTALAVCQAISIAMTVVLPGTGGEFQGDAQEFRIGLGFGTFEVGQELAGAGCLGRHLGQPDRRLDRKRRPGSTFAVAV